MSAFPHLPLFTDAFIADTVHLNAQETGAYLMLMMVAWRSAECRLPDDDDRLARFARVDRRTWARLKPTVMAFWVLSEGSWSQKRLSKEREFVSKRAEVNRENGKRGGRPKSLENNDAASPAGSFRVSETKAPIPIPIPTPKEDKNPQDPNGSSAPKGAEPSVEDLAAAERGRAAKRKRRLPEDFQPGERSRKTLLTLQRPTSWGWEAFAEMKDWADGSGERKLDWDATLAGWMRRKAQDERRKGGPRDPPGSTGRSNPYQVVTQEALEQGYGTGSDASAFRPRLVAGSRH